MEPIVRIKKRDGRLEPMMLDKFQRVIDWAAHGLSVSSSQVQLQVCAMIYDGMTTDELHLAIAKVCSDLITADAPDYAIMNARLLMFRLRKIAYGKFECPPLYEHIVNLIDIERYDSAILKDYTKAEIDELNGYLKHDRDMTYKSAAVQQFEGKYLVQNRVTMQIYESPQMLYMLVAMCLFSLSSKADRLRKVKAFYDATSTGKISLPTPIMSGVRTPTRQFSSCVVMAAGDSLDSINATASSIVKYVSQRAGIGIDAGRIRALGSPIRGGEAFHTGIIPFLKYFQTAVKSCSQGGVRGGAATVFYPIWHLEVESLLVLKNNRGVEENRVRHLDYGVQINKLMYQRLIDGKEITLFSPSDVPGLYDAYFADQEKFERLYVQAEADPSIRKKSIKAVELFSMMMQERASTGRIYVQNVDHCNTHSAFNPAVAPITQSNLCLEIALPTAPLQSIESTDGEISLCTLAAVNLGMINKVEELEPLCELLVEALDSLLDYQDYPIPAAKKSTHNRRPLGVGAINFAYALAKRGLKYSDGSAVAYTHEVFEALQFYLLKASCNLAKDKGACPSFNETSYAQGLLPIDTYKKEVDEYCDAPLAMDWEALRAMIAQYGLRNSTLTALMPSETSSQIANATNGIEPPRGAVSVKSSKHGQLRQVVPDVEELRYQYEYLWEMPSNLGYLQLVGIMQKFVDQSISANTNYDPAKFPGNKVPMQVLLGDLLTAYKFGVKTLYYHNTRDGAGEVPVDGGKSMGSGADAVDVAPEDDCEGGACKI